MLKYTIVLLLLNYSIASNGPTYNDYCVDDSHCTNGYNCVSVETKNINLLPDISISQCIKEPICSGNNFGNCPDFSKWPPPYKDINSKCIFSFINGCNTTAECYKNNNKDAYGIYKCIDTNTIVMLTDLYENNGKGDDRGSDRSSNQNDNNKKNSTVAVTIIPRQTTAKDTNVPLATKSYANKIILNILCIVINFIIIIYLI